MKKASKSQIEAAAKAIMFLVPLDTNVVAEGSALIGWTPYGIAHMRWPKDFGPAERKLIRLIAKKALEAK